MTTVSVDVRDRKGGDDAVPLALVFPGEHPEAVQLKTWLEAATSELTSLGFNPIIADRSPAVLAPYAQKDLADIPALVVGGSVSEAMAQTREALRKQ